MPEVGNGWQAKYTKLFAALMAGMVTILSAGWAWSSANAKDQRDRLRAIEQRVVRVETLTEVVEKKITRMEDKDAERDKRLIEIAERARQIVAERENAKR